MLRFLAILAVFSILVTAAPTLAYGVMVYSITVDLSRISEFQHAPINFTWDYIVITWNNIDIPTAGSSIIFKLYTDPSDYSDASTAVVVAFYANGNYGIYVGSPKNSISPVKKGYWNQNETVKIDSGINVYIDGEKVMSISDTSESIKAYGIVPVSLTNASGTITINFYQELDMAQSLNSVTTIIIAVIPAIVVIGAVKTILGNLKL